MLQNELLGNLLHTHIQTRFIDTRAIYTRPNSTIHDDRGHDLLQCNAARKTGLLPQTDLCLTGSDTRHITYIG